MRAKITDFSRLKPTAVSLQDLYRYNLVAQPAQRIRNAQFLHKELPIRLAQRIEELSNLPFGLAQKSGVIEVKEVFIRGFENLLTMNSPQTIEDDERFTNLLKTILMDNTSVIQSMAFGVLEVRQDMGSLLTPIRSITLDTYLNRFFMARIGLRFLLEHHISAKNNTPGFSGIIQSNCNPMIVAQNAADESMQLCETHFGVTPLVRIQSPNPKETFTYVPAHLHYILSELLKNALRATVNFHGVDKLDLPAVDVVIARGRSDVTIKISDRGGGIPFDKVCALHLFFILIFMYDFTFLSKCIFVNEIDLILFCFIIFSHYLIVIFLYVSYVTGWIDMDILCDLFRHRNSSDTEIQISKYECYPRSSSFTGW